VSWRDSKYRQGLNKFYDKLADELRGADQILILGPGEARGELAARLERSKVLGSRVIALDSVYKLPSAG